MSEVPQTRINRFIAELKRRHIVRVAIGYAAVVFILLQLSEIVLPAFLQDPEAGRVLRVVVVVSLLFFPVALALAWVYEITPQGIRSMAAIDAEAGVPEGRMILPRLALLGITIAAGTAGWWWWVEADVSVQNAAVSNAPVFQASTVDDGSTEIRSVAVLPLEILSAEEGNEYFSASLHEAIIDEVGQLETLRVVSRTSMRGYQSAGKSLPQMGSELNVDALLEGSVRIVGDQVEISVRLIHAGSEDQRWSARFTRDMNDILGLQREVAAAIAREIGLEAEASLEPLERTAVADESTPAIDAPTIGPAEQPAAATPVNFQISPESQRSYLEGRMRLTDAADEPAQIEAARSYFNVALDEDPEFVPALTGLAGSELLLGLEAEGEERVVRLVESRDLAHRALAVDPENQEAREVLYSVEDALVAAGRSLGDNVTIVDGFSDQMVAMFASIDDGIILLPSGDTLPLNKSMAPVFTSMGQVLQQRFVRSGADGWQFDYEMGEAEAAAAEADGRRIPLRGALHSSLRLANAGEVEDAIDQLEDLIDDNATVPWEAFEVLEHLYRIDGDMEEILDLRAERADRFPQEASPGIEALERNFDLGMPGYWAWKHEEQALRRAQGQPVFATVDAIVAAGLEQEDEALAALRDAARSREPALALVSHDPVWDDVRSDRRFRALFRTIRFDGFVGDEPGRLPRR